jgi:hypothetical protein
VNKIHSKISGGIRRVALDTCKMETMLEEYEDKRDRFL